MKTNNFHYITIPLLYFIHKIRIAEDLLISFCIGLNGVLQNIPKYPEIMLDHIYLSLCLLRENPEMIKKHLEPKFENENSFIRIPQLLMMYITFVHNAIFKAVSETTNIKMLLIRISMIEYGQYSIFILSAVLNNLKSVINSKNNEFIANFVDFCFLYLNFIIHYL